MFDHGLIKVNGTKTIKERDDFDSSIRIASNDSYVYNCDFDKILTLLVVK